MPTSPALRRARMFPGSTARRASLAALLLASLVPSAGSRLVAYEAAHLARLKQGVAAFNAWRARHPDLKPDLSGIELFGADLQGVNLLQANLRGARLLAHTKLIRSNLALADLRGATLRADLRWAVLTKARLGQADLSGSPLGHADLTAVRARGASFAGSGVSDANFHLAQLTGARFGGAVAYRSVFTSAILDQSDFTTAHLLSTNFSGSSLKRAIFVGASLGASDFSATDISGADFSGARGELTNFSHSKAVATAFRKAHLGLANFSHSKIQQADFSTALLETRNCDALTAEACTAQFFFARRDDRTRFPKGFAAPAPETVFTRPVASECWEVSPSGPGEVWIRMPARRHQCSGRDYRKLYAVVAMLTERGVRPLEARVCYQATCAGCRCPSSRWYRFLIRSNDYAKIRSVGYGWTRMPAPQPPPKK